MFIGFIATIDFIFSSNDWMINHRKELPIWLQRSDIIHSIQKNQVTVITGETGSGKTTQVPQFILEHAFDNQSACKIIVTEPRRLGNEKRRK